MRGTWFTELQTADLSLSSRIKNIVHVEKTPFQELAILDTEPFGRMLVLDGVIQTTVNDEFGYHEMITHVPLNTHPCPENVLVVGGGDGGSVREILKNPHVQQVTLVEIDERVVAAAKRYLPETSCSLDDSRVKIIFEDGIKHVGTARNLYDVIVVDAPDPVGPAEGLFNFSFYEDLNKALKEDGIFTSQMESPYFNSDLIRRVFHDVEKIFTITKLFLSIVPSYPGGLWSFILGSKKLDPEEVNISLLPGLSTKYYSAEVHRSAFVLPPFVREMLK